MVGVLARQEADWGILDFSPSHERNQVAEFSIPFSWDNVVILAKAPDFVVKPFLLLEIFSPLVWAALVGAVLFGSITLWLVETAESNLDELGYRPPPPLYHRCGSVFGVYVQQTESRVWAYGTGGRALTACILMTGIIICATYSGSVTAFLAIPFRAKAIDSLEDLAHSSVLPSVRTRVSVYNFLLQNNYTGAMARLKLNLKQFSGAYMSSWDYFKQVEEAKYAFIDTFSSAVGRSIEHENEGGRCRFRIARTIVKSDVDAFAYARNTPIRHRVDKMLTWLRYYGILEHLRSKYFSLPCFEEATNDGPKSLDLIQAQGAFYVLVLGYCACVTCFFSELLVSTLKRLRQEGDVHSSDRAEDNIWKNIDSNFDESPNRKTIG
ncbi:glutamate receptor ionotropic, delta-1-like [Oratosquilla oratoria]|uniref:glutamate receptor ionotropic, delta-1-like n=1 Tax=Oratosquilla oratoria TaxID=337810 RepID=UPI003F76DDCA